VIRHISGRPLLAELLEVKDATAPVRCGADRHDVHVLISSAWPGVGRCDSCGRIIVRGMGRWWERGVWS
jgi:hypothetical protein